MQRDQSQTLSQRFQQYRASKAVLFGACAGSVVVATIVGFSAPLSDSVVAVPVLATIGGVASSIIIMLSLPRLIAGIGLLKYRQWGRVLKFVVSILGLVDFPVGTGLGVYALWVLLHRETIPLFEDVPQAVPQR